jgi:glycosyltransferase involved in cell wall biosynthesis
MLNLAKGFSENKIETDVVVVENTGELSEEIDPCINLIDLHKKHSRNAILEFRKYLIRNAPDVVIAVQTHVQLMIILAIIFSGWKGRLILNEQSTFSKNVNYLLRICAGIFFRKAYVITVVSKYAAADFINVFPLLEKKTVVIYNPVDIKKIKINKDIDSLHPFLKRKGKEKLILSAGRLSKVKNFSLLIDAFTELLNSTDARLIILGEGEERNALQYQIENYGIADKVSLPGYTSNPYAYMSRADVFVLTSLYEGLPTVITEALCCGCNIVSVESASGINEILDFGKYGIITISEKKKLAVEIMNSFSFYMDRTGLDHHLLKFSNETITQKYLELISR